MYVQLLVAVSSPRTQVRFLFCFSFPKMLIVLVLLIQNLSHILTYSVHILSSILVNLLLIAEGFSKSYEYLRLHQCHSVGTLKLRRI